MSLLASLTSDGSIKDETDSVGGSKFSVKESGLYEGKVSLAYLKKSEGGALALNMTVVTEDGSEIKQDFWMTSGTAKGGKNYYEKDGQKSYLPGYLAANSLCLLTVGQEISAMETEEKVVKLYSFEAKAEVPTKVSVITDLIGKDILIGLIKQEVDKNAKDASGVYVATGETQLVNEVDKFFRASDRMTTAEIRATATEAVFVNTWEDKWKGVTKNKAKGAKAGGTAGLPKPAAGGSGKPVTSIFS